MKLHKSKHRFSHSKNENLRAVLLSMYLYISLYIMFIYNYYIFTYNILVPGLSTRGFELIGVGDFKRKNVKVYRKQQV